MHIVKTKQRKSLHWIDCQTKMKNQKHTTWICTVAQYNLIYLLISALSRDCGSSLVSNCGPVMMRLRMGYFNVGVLESKMPTRTVMIQSCKTAKRLKSNPTSGSDRSVCRWTWGDLGSVELWITNTHWFFCPVCECDDVWHSYGCRWGSFHSRSSHKHATKISRTRPDLIMTCKSWLHAIQTGFDISHTVCLQWH